MSERIRGKTKNRGSFLFPLSKDTDDEDIVVPVADRVIIYLTMIKSVLI